MIVWVIALVIWVVGIFVAYNKFMKHWENQSKFERKYFAIIWPLVLPLYLVHWIHNKF